MFNEFLLPGTINFKAALKIYFEEIKFFFEKICYYIAEYELKF